MPNWLPSIDYAPATEGFWSPITSTLNWCEEDYYATPYVAEIVNTTTNLWFQYLAYRGIKNCLDQGHDGIFITTFLGYGLIGLGSFLFHMTLKYPWQLLDELSMIYTVCLMFYATFSHNQKPPVPLTLGVSLIVAATSMTAYYHYIQDPFFHQIVFGVLTSSVLIRGFHVTEVMLRPSRKTASKGATQEAVAERARQDARDLKIVHQMEVLIGTGLAIFLGGFLVWNLDNIYCHTVRSWRRDLGLPWGVVLEGHAWWHLMTGLGAYFWIVWGIWLRHCVDGRQDEFRLHWPRVLSLPIIVRADESKENKTK